MGRNIEAGIFRTKDSCKKNVGRIAAKLQQDYSSCLHSSLLQVSGLKDERGKVIIMNVGPITPWQHALHRSNEISFWLTLALHQS
ncbi:hypothetical protein Lalb_Chr19g0130731 [Lupinus albus]|uniref:Uncharacterized protein n=1 Tax=Lupinus albus TaxID=3870 RepID=A0A6A4NPD8_LUPAL|nr:hypothetical protein Lalb_Chr19g0130731 [Lupinus albus]